MELQDYSLSKANIWLRNRAGIWEIKHPSIAGSNPNTNKIAVYTEVVGEENVQKWLADNDYLDVDSNILHYYTVPLYMSH